MFKKRQSINNDHHQTPILSIQDFFTRIGEKNHRVPGLAKIIMEKRLEHASNPVYKKRFYLEIKNAPQLQKTLTHHIKYLGGSIDPFWNKDVHYVVTNRPKQEWAQKSDVQSSGAGAVNLLALSRARKILHTCQTQQLASDVIALARSCNRKVIHSNDFMEFMKKHITDLPTEDKDGNSLEDCRRLAPPFIKVVDNSLKYKANFKELAEWPEVNFEFQPELCPFHKPRKLNNNASQQSNKSTTMIGRPNDKFQTMLTTPIMTTPTLNLNNIKSIPTKNNISKRKHFTFCEICHKEYDDFEKHLNDEAHTNFLNNDNNFADIFSVIKSLPPFLSQIRQKKKMKVQAKRNFSDISNVIVGNTMTTTTAATSSSVQSPMTMSGMEGKTTPTSTTRRSTNSLDQNTFMAIHNIVLGNDEKMKTMTISVKERGSPIVHRKDTAMQDFENIENNTSSTFPLPLL